MKLAKRILALALLLVTCSSVHAGVTYAYDDLGRVVQATYTDGNIVQYQYDANGNITSINRLQTSTLSISSFTPAIGQANSVVTITGSGFSATPGSNAVTVGGAAAVVSSASPTQLVITVPMNAQTGTIGVTVGANSTASAQQFVVRRPEIASFSPSVVNAGATITVVGNNFALAPPTATVVVGGVAATVTSATNTQIVFTAPANGSGTIQVNTSYGQATSASALTVMPWPISAANVGAVASATAGGASVAVTNVQAGKLAVIAFNATAGQLISVQSSNVVSVPSNVTAGFTVYSQTGAAVASGSIAASLPSSHLPAMPATGRYLLVLNPGNATFQFNAVVELNSMFTNTAASTVSVSTTTNLQSKRVGITVGAGQHVSIGLQHLTMSGAGSIILGLYQPNGTKVWDHSCYTTDPVSSCGLSSTDLPVAGTYQLYATPNGTATMSYDLTISPPVLATLVSGTPTTVNMAQPAQVAVYSFTVTQGQAFAIGVDSIATTPAGINVYVSLRGPNGEIANRTTTGNFVFNYSSAAAGTYRVVMVPSYGVTASIRLSLSLATPPLLPSDGTTSATLTTAVPGQNGYYDIPATAGQNIAIALRHLTMSPAGSVNLSLYQPNGTYIWGRSCYTTDPVSSCGIQFTNLPVSGNYHLVATPSNAATMSFDLTVSQALTGTLTHGNPVSLNMSIPGQFAYYSFTATSGASYALNLGSIATNPVGYNLWMSVMRPDGSTYWSGDLVAGSTPTLNVTNTVAGTWKVFIVPYFGLSGSAQITLSNTLTGSLIMNDAPAHFSTTVPGQSVAITFQGTAGTTVELASTNMSTNPTSVSGMSFSVWAPNGQQAASFTASRTSNPGDSSAFNVSQTGTYTIFGSPTGPGTAGFDLNISTPFTGTIVKGGGPLFVNMARPAQFGYLAFTATAGQSLTINFTSVTTVPANIWLWIDVVNPGGSTIASAPGTAATRQINLSGLAAGTYHIYVWPTQAVTTSMNIEIP